MLRIAAVMLPRRACLTSWFAVPNTVEKLEPKGQQETRVMNTIVLLPSRRGHARQWAGCEGERGCDGQAGEWASQD